MAILSGISEDAEAWGRVTLCHPNSLFLQWKHFLGLWEKGSLRSMDFTFTQDLRSLIDPFMFCWQSNDILSADPTSIKNCLKFFGWIQSHVRFVRKLQQRWGFLWSCSSYWVKSSLLASPEFIEGQFPVRYLGLPLISVSSQVGTESLW